MRKIRVKNYILLGILICILVSSVSISLTQFLHMDLNESVNQIRIDINPHVEQVKNGNYEVFQYPYLCLSTDGKIKYSDPVFGVSAGEQVNIQEMLQMDESFFARNPNRKKEVFIMTQNNKTIGFVVYLVPKRLYYKNTPMHQVLRCFLPILIGAFLCISILTVHILYLNHCVIHPITEISTSAKAIIAGNYDQEVLRTYGTKIGENEIGDLTYSFELMRDELKEKQIREESLKKSQQELISCISHDLRTPISTIKAYVEGLRDGIAKTEENRKMFLEIILQKVTILTKMIHDLLEYSNTQLNQLTIIKQDVYFNAYFIPLSKELEIYVKQQDATLKVHSISDDILVNIDEKRITEVFYNVIENSIKYRSENPLQIDITVTYKDHFLTICVKDNGIGIHPDDVSHIFDKFYRAEKSRTSAIPGSGLGLSICNYIIEQHGGTMYCKSQHGCEIGFTIPF